MELTQVSHWNYRLVKRQLDEDSVFGIYEVYYDSEGVIVGCMTSPVTIVGSSPGEALWRVDLMLTAFEKPTLNYDDITGGDEDG